MRQKGKKYALLARNIYRPRMREGNVFILSVYLSVRAITFEYLEIESSFFVW